MKNKSLSGWRMTLATNKVRLLMLFAQRASLGDKNWLDKCITSLLRVMLSPKNPSKDFMRDELVDAEISFTPEELNSYQGYGENIHR